jgi:6-phosphofructokinase
MGRYFGIASVDLIVKGFGKMVSYRNGKITAVPLQEAIGKLNSWISTLNMIQKGIMEEERSWEQRHEKCQISKSKCQMNAKFQTIKN